MHDAFQDAAARLLRSDSLPDCGGIPVTIIATVNADDLAAGTGLARTGHGGLVSIPELLKMADETDIVTVVEAKKSTEDTSPAWMTWHSGPTRHVGGVLSYGRDRRLASPGQRLALIARDGGCSFPGCTAPPTRTQTHHVIAWIDGGSTDLDNLTLLCGYHHRSFDAAGWACQMVDGVPYWQPPRWIDAKRRPRRNVVHHSELNFGAAVDRDRLAATGYLRR